MCTVYTLTPFLFMKNLHADYASKKAMCHTIILSVVNKCISLCKRLHKIELKSNDC